MVEKNLTNTVLEFIINHKHPIDRMNIQYQLGLTKKETTKALQFLFKNKILLRDDVNPVNPKFKNAGTYRINENWLNQKECNPTNMVDGY